MTDEEIVATVNRVNFMRAKPSEEEATWMPAKYNCKKCGWIIWSRWPGHFASCACGDSFVDQTRYYGRFGGNVEPLNKYEVIVYFVPETQEFVLGRLNHGRLVRFYSETQYTLQDERVPPTALMWSTL